MCTNICNIYIYICSCQKCKKKHLTKWPCLWDLVRHLFIFQWRRRVWKAPSPLSHGPMAASGYRAGSSSFLGRVAPESQLYNIRFRYQYNICPVIEKKSKVSTGLFTGNQDEAKT